MKKTDLNALYRAHAKNQLSPTKEEQALVSKLYEAFKNAIGGQSIIIGSYARYTAIRPLHDLDILYIDGKFDPANLKPQQILSSLENLIKTKFQNPTQFEYKASLQTHSVTIAFMKNGQEVFAVDIVPAFSSGAKNEYGDDIYWVPEILLYGPRRRRTEYKTLNETKKNEVDWWLKSDPRGYIRAATELNALNSDFRKAAKLVKRWKHNCKAAFPEFKLKSFHVEQIVYEIVRSTPRIEISDVIFAFLQDLPNFIQSPRIRDRADTSKFIDDYVGQLNAAERGVILEARDAFMLKLENIGTNTSIASLLEASRYQRTGIAEEFLFDQGIPTYIDPSLVLTISGNVLGRNGGFREFLLDLVGRIEVDRKIEFRVARNTTSADTFKWKVKNDNSSQQPRGEITDHRTRNDPEIVKYNGQHYVECFAIKGGVCVAKARQNVVLDRWI